MRVLELYSGIGGMHYALKESGLKHEVIAAADVNNVANEIYAHNFPDVKIIRKGIEALSVKDWERLAPDLVTMSPPCQPFTRQGLKKDTQDDRCRSFLHILEVLTRLESKPTYLLLENVKGFEDSTAHDKLLDTLDQCGYQYQEFLVSPLQLGIPNQRLRYYLLASRASPGFSFQTQPQIWEELPVEANVHLINRRPCSSELCLHSSNLPENANCSLAQPITEPDIKLISQSETPAHELVERSLQKYIDHCRPIQDYLVKNSDQIIFESNRTLNSDQTDANESELRTCAGQSKESLRGLQTGSVDQSELLLDIEQCRRYLVLDVVNAESQKSICFTKSYSRLLDGCGSVLQQNLIETGDLFADGRRFLDADSEELSKVRSLGLRFFSPREVVNLMAFPDRFSFPSHITRGQCYQTLGNSLNCHVVSVLLRLLVAPSGGDT